MAGVVVLVLVAALVGRASAAATDVFGPACSTYSDPPPAGWKLWSKASTWANGVVPGTGAAMGIDVTIPCDTGIILDTSITVDKLIVNGWLKVEHAGPFQVLANFVIIQGRLTIGTVAQPYTGKIVFNLTSGGYEYDFTRPEGSNTVGTKAFAVIGGVVELNGMYGNQKGWTTLTKTAPKGSTSITLQGDVSAWPVGGTIAIASTDYQWTQAEQRTITAVVKGSGVTTLSLDAPLTYMHWGDPIETGVNGVTMSESAEVALLDRTIVIQGAPEADKLMGGHFIVMQTQLPQKIIGIELNNMGQQGFLGRYPMHFHLCQDVTGSYVKSISVHHSNQRCIVIHGTFNHLIDGNAAYATKGHCFFLEDGIEYGNTFSNNLGFLTDRPQRRIPRTNGGALQSDDAPSTFWISNPNNTWINNVAAGSVDSGYWFELEGNVLGPSKGLPGSSKVFPRWVPLKSFIGNVAHSNMRAGLRTYSVGMRPRENGGVNGNGNPINAPHTHIVFKDLRVYKNAMDGMFIHETDSLIVDGGFYADNGVVSIELHQVEHIEVKNAIILGETANIGNPSGCDQGGNAYANCRPLNGCQLPVDPSQARSSGAGQTRRDGPMFGILIDQTTYPSNGLTIEAYSKGAPLPQHFDNVTFGMFDNRCKVAAGITANGRRSTPLFLASHSSKGLNYVDNSPRIYMTPRPNGILGFETAGDAGSTADVYVFRDEDGSLIGGPGGYVVANNPALLPYGEDACTPMPGNYGWACENVCYRSVGFTVSGSGSPTFTITRVLDGASFTHKGFSGTTFINLLSGTIYQVSISPTPSRVRIWYGDPEGCKGTVILQVAAPSGSKWAASGATWLSCAGSDNDPEAMIQVAGVCGTATPIMQVIMGGETSSSVYLDLQSGTLSCNFLNCGIFPAKSDWLYNDQGAKLPSPEWSASSYSTDGWFNGYGLFGFGGAVDTSMKTGGQMNGVTWYFKRTFEFEWVNCMDTLNVGIIVNDAVVLYINGKEVYRNNLPSGAISADTQALSSKGDWQTPAFTLATLNIHTLGLVSGINTVAVEVHASNKYAWNQRFDMWATASGDTCTASTLYETADLPIVFPEAPKTQSPPPKKKSPPPPKKKSPPPKRSTPPPKKRSPPPPRKSSPPLKKRSPPPPKKRSPPPKRRSPPPPRTRRPPPPGRRFPPPPPKRA